MMRKVLKQRNVVKITDQGYVTSHGDQYHYFDGKVPFDAIISEELIIRDPNYTLQEADIVNEVKDGLYHQGGGVLSLPQGCQTYQQCPLGG